MINTVASDVTAVLGFTPSKDFDDFVGIGAQITEIKSKLILQSEQVKMTVLVGPAGIGKTTTATVLYNQLSPGFPFSTFLENIRGSYEKPCGNDYNLKLSLQKNLVAETLNQKDIEVCHLGVAQQRLSDKKVFVFLMKWIAGGNSRQLHTSADGLVPGVLLSLQPKIESFSSNSDWGSIISTRRNFQLKMRLLRSFANMLSVKTLRMMVLKSLLGKLLCLLLVIFL